MQSQYARSIRRQVERLLEDHGVDLRLPASDGCCSFKPIEALLVIEYRNVGIAAVCPRNSKLSAVSRADAMGDVEFDHTALRCRIDRMGDQSVFVRGAVRNVGSRQFE